MTLRHGPHLLIPRKDPGFQNQAFEKTSPDLLFRAQGQQVGAQKDQLLCGQIGISSGNCQETELQMVWACHKPRQPLQIHSSMHLGKWRMLWLAKEMLDGQWQRTDIPAPARFAHNVHPQ